MHIKIIPSILMLLAMSSIWAQEATEIILFDLQLQDGNYVISNPTNISNQEGYDNQPSFSFDGKTILFTSFRNDQADIAEYHILNETRSWLTNTPESEFSPQSYPNKKKNFSCVMMDEDDNQYLYKYSYKKKPSELLIGDMTIGYYTWFDAKTIVSFVLGETESLMVTNLKYKINYPIQDNIGRSFQRIPNTDLLSFINKKHEVAEIYSINPSTSKYEYLIDALPESEDMVWHPNDGTIFMGKQNELFKMTLGEDKTWQKVIINSDIEISGISRLAISPDGKKIALVSNE